jgi:undecaprenyl diphosphate synthase
VTRTSVNEGLTLVVALNYGGRSDLVSAMRQLGEQVAAGTVDPERIDEESISRSLSTAGIPDPDLVIRTSGEMRVSNFLLWEIAYSELWVTSTLWPDFSRSDLLKAVIDFQKRRRRFGGTR